jgi:hypothetical protein
MHPLDNPAPNHSTGPRTPEGKAISSANSLKHGLASGRLLLRDEDPAEFEALVLAFEKDHQPANTAEAVLVYDLAKYHWLTDRAIRFQQGLFFDSGAVDTFALPVLIRYQNTNHRAFLATLKALQTLQKERKSQDDEFVSSTRDPHSPDFIPQPSSISFTDENGVPWDSPLRIPASREPFSPPRPPA